MYIVTLLYLRARFICLFWNLILNLAAWIGERSLLIFIHPCWYRILISLNLKWTINTYGVKSKTDSFCKYSKKLPNFPVQWSKQKYKYSWMSIRMIVIFSRIPVSQYTEWKRNIKKKSKAVFSFCVSECPILFCIHTSLLYNCKYEIIKSSFFP